MGKPFKIKGENRGQGVSSVRARMIAEMGVIPTWPCEKRVV